jgi:hypothetical protein
MIASLLLSLWTAAPLPASAREVGELSVCRGVPADSARPGLWDCRRLGKDSLRVLARLLDGGILEWSAERGLQAEDLPEEAFWKILDAFAGEQGEWLEREPASMGKETARFPEALEQAFECRNCPQPLIAGTAGKGATRLMISLRAGDATAVSRTLALRRFAQADPRDFPVLASMPCRIKGGACQDVRLGPGGARWTFRRTRPDSDWESLRVEWQGRPLGDSVSLDGLREDMPPKEFRMLLGNWLESEGDLFLVNVIAPGQPFLTASPDDWRRHRLRGFRTERLLAQLENAHAVPSSVLLYQDETCRIGIRDGLRWMEVRKASP